MKTNDDGFFTDTKEYTSKHKLAWIVWMILLVLAVICTFAFIGSLTLEELPVNTVQTQ